jgi:hypothetical protein
MGSCEPVLDVGGQGARLARIKVDGENACA